MSSLYCYLFYFSLARVVLHRARANEWAQQNGHVTCTYGSLGSVPRVGTRVVFRHLI